MADINFFFYYENKWPYRFMFISIYSYIKAQEVSFTKQITESKRNELDGPSSGLEKQTLPKVSNTPKESTPPTDLKLCVQGKEPTWLCRY